MQLPRHSRCVRPGHPLSVRLGRSDFVCFFFTLGKVCTFWFQTEKQQAQVVDLLDFTAKERVPSPNCVDMFAVFDLQHIFPIDFFLLIVSQPTKIST